MGGLEAGIYIFRISLGAGERSVSRVYAADTSVCVWCTQVMVAFRVLGALSSLTNGNEPMIPYTIEVTDHGRHLRNASWVLKTISIVSSPIDEGRILQAMAYTSWKRSTTRAHLPYFLCRLALLSLIVLSTLALRLCAPLLLGRALFSFSFSVSSFLISTGTTAAAASPSVSASAPPT